MVAESQDRRRLAPRRQIAHACLAVWLATAGSVAGAEEAVDPALLEFLATWEAEDEDWFDVAVEEETNEARRAGATANERRPEEHNDGEE